MQLATIPFQQIGSSIAAVKNCRLTVWRWDNIHEAVSGNKWFKLAGYLDKYKKGNYSAIISFGGPFSNHLAAAAFACHQLNIPFTAIVRGYSHLSPTPTIASLVRLNASIKWVNKSTYEEWKNLASSACLPNQWPQDALIIPEGGYGETGLKGIVELCREHKDELEAFSHILVSVGSGTTLAGLVAAAADHQKVWGYTAVNDPKIANNIESLSPQLSNKWQLFNASRRGFGKVDEELTSAMNRIYQEFALPTDLVYTAKAWMKIEEQIDASLFPNGSHLLFIHTGGLQGNHSLPSNRLVF